MHTIRLILFLELTLLFVSCQDELNYSLNRGDITSVKMIAPNFISADSVSTRTILTPTDNGTAFSWKIGDVVAVYSSLNGMTNFYIDNESISEDGTSADFNGSGFKLLGNSTYFAFYPYSSSIQSLDKTAIPVSYLGQNMKGNGDFSSLGNFDYMYASGITNNNGTAALSFQHLGCVVEYKLTVPKTANYTQVRLELKSNTDEYLLTSGIVDITAESPFIYHDDAAASDSILMVELNAEGNGIRVIKDSLLTIYMMMPPQDLSDNKITIRLVDNEQNWYTAVVDGKNMRAGYTYHYEVSKQNGGFTGSGTGLPNEDISLKLLSIYTNASKMAYEGMVLDGNILYTSGRFGVRSIDYSNEISPVLQSRVDIKRISNNRSDMSARSIAIKNNILYVPLRQTSTGPNENCVPSMKFGFENNLGNYNDHEIINEISSNDTVSAFFKELRLNSINYNQTFKVLYLYKGFYQNGYYLNTINLQGEDGTSAVLFRETFNTREEAMNALKAEYRNNKGDYCKVDWSALPQNWNVFRGVEFYNVGGFDTYTHTGTASISSSTEACPNTGCYSICIDSGEGVADNSAIFVTSNLSSATTNGCVSFWLNVENISSHAEMPLLGLSGENVLSFIVNQSGADGYNIGLALKGNSVTGISKLNKGEWYNFKIRIQSNSVVLCYRSKECADWIEEVEMPSAISFDQLTTGLNARGNGIKLYFDDYYYNESDIDDVSYVNGKLAILDKNTLDVYQIFNLDVKAIDAKIYGNRLVVTCFYGFNVYDISDAINPKLTYSYRVSSFKEFQNCEIFENSGKVYAFICNYSQGYTIADITDVNDVSISYINDYKSMIYNEENLYGKIYNFDVHIDYPYAYLTNATMRTYLNTESDRRGILTIDLSDLNNPNPHFSFVAADLVTEVTNGDPRPTRIARSGDFLIINNTEKGLLVFKIGKDGKPEYNSLVNIPGKPSVNEIYVPYDGLIFVNDNDDGGSKYSDRNIYLYRMF